MIERGHHDMGGLPAGKVERTEHDYAEWERRVDAMAQLLRGMRIITVDELPCNPIQGKQGQLRHCAQHEMRHPCGQE